MADIERFEARVVSALGQLADEAPTEVNVAQLVERITAAGHASRWSTDIGARRMLSAFRLSLGATAQAALVVAAIAILVVSVVLSQRIAPSPYAGALFGQITCSGEAWTSSRPEAAVLDCSTELRDARLVGSARIDIGAATAVTRFELRHASVVLRADGATWVGSLELMLGRNGTAVGDAILDGRGDAAGLVARLHLVSGDGLTWGVVGSMETTR